MKASALHSDVGDARNRLGAKAVSQPECEIIYDGLIPGSGKQIGIAVEGVSWQIRASGIDQNMKVKATICCNLQGLNRVVSASAFDADDRIFM